MVVHSVARLDALLEKFTEQRITRPEISELQGLLQGLRDRGIGDVVSEEAKEQAYTAALLLHALDVINLDPFGRMIEHEVHSHWR